jgi:hypothetical protein
VALAARKGLEVLAITDHDTTEGVPEAVAAGEEFGVRVIPGVEISTDTPLGHVDVLGYFVDVDHPELRDTLVRIRDARYYRAQEMVEKLGRLGCPIRFERVLELAGEGAVGRPHVAQALLEAGYVSTISEAFERYIGWERPAYVDRFRLTPVQACRLIRAAGGAPSLAHPVPVEDPLSDPKNLPALLPELVRAGLMGLECYYPGYPPAATRRLLDLAARFDLIPTGGSDFHGAVKPEIELGMVEVPPASVTALEESLGLKAPG